MEDIVLPDTSLCAIVRDEVMNPAGGIMRFLRSVMPHVEEGVVVDTGSQDGTRELLEEAKKTFPHLRVYDETFIGYAEARNRSLKEVRTIRALILDADEIILQRNYESLRGSLLQDARENSSVLFNFIDIYNGDYEGGFTESQPRIIEPAGKEFYNNRRWNEEFLKRWPTSAHYQVSSILHFHNSDRARKLKSKKWYRIFEVPNMAPSEIEGFEEWKAFNPRRNEYTASNLDKAEIPVIAA